MRNKRTISVSDLTIAILFVGMGLLISCGESDTQTDDIDTGDVGEEPQATVRDNAEDTTQQQGEGEIFEASLEGANQVPEVDSEATGNITVTLQEDTIHVQGGFSGLRGEYVASHIHLGAEHENGDPVIPLDPELGEEDLSGNWDESHQLDEELVSALKADSLYINVHSEEHQKGEIRGQLSPANKNTDMNTEM